MEQRSPIRAAWGVVLVLVFGAAWGGRPGGQVPAPGPAIEAQVEAAFSKAFSATTPGCAVAVAANGQVVLSKAWGMADLEHGVPLTPDTIFEAGSVSKQFTAAAILLLARDGKLSLDDPVRRHVPELPDYGVPLTIRHLLQHTSGLRDWGSVASLAGWPRTTRAYTHAHVLDIVGRQKALNFTPGTDWSYSNTGYNLAAIIVSRVAGEPFQEFTRRRLFQPLGMTRTSWRDNHARVVRDRAIAYRSTRGGVIETLMPFEHVFGNGGLLTTVGDLLRWNANLTTPTVGDAAFVAEMQREGRLASGRPHGYGLGLYVGTYRGVREVSHSGSTAGYRAFLARYPDQRLSAAALCNWGSANAEQHLHAVVDLYLADHLRPPVRPGPPAVPADKLGGVTGLYRSRKLGTVLAIVRDKDALRLEQGPTLTILSPRQFRWGAGILAEFVPAGSPGEAPTLTVRYANGTEDVYDRVDRARPTMAALVDYVGRYDSDEVETSLAVVSAGERLEMRRRPDTTMVLRPLYTDAFSTADTGGGDILVRFRRNARGQVIGMSVGSSRVWDMRFERVAKGPQG